MKNKPAKFKLFVLFLLSFFVFHVLQAQRKPYAAEKYIGLQGGISRSMVFFKPSVSQSLLSSYNGGIVFRYIQAKSLGLQAELNYSERGWLEKATGFERQLNYIELPLLTHFNFGKNFRYFFNIGPSVSYLISDKNNAATLQNLQEYQQLNTVRYPFEYGLAVGTGFYVRIKKQVFQLEARANVGATDIYSNSISDEFDYSKNIHAQARFSWLIQTN